MVSHKPSTDNDQMTIPRIGIYEKALPPAASWRALAESTLRSGYDFIELSIDSSTEKLDRLNFQSSERRAIRDAFAESGIAIDTVNLSALREYELGSSDADRRQRGTELLDRAIDFCADLGARSVLVPGYYSFGAPAGTEGRARFVAAVARAADKAAQRRIVIAIENMDGSDVTNMTQARALIEDINSPWVKLCADVGNLCANGLDACRELRIARTAIAGIHLKETLPGIFRGVRIGEGIVPFEAIIATLYEMNYHGSFVVEMWNERHPDAEWIAATTQAWIRDLIGARYSACAQNL